MAVTLVCFFLFWEQTAQDCDTESVSGSRLHCWAIVGGRCTLLHIGVDLEESPMRKEGNSIIMRLLEMLNVFDVERMQENVLKSRNVFKS